MKNTKQNNARMTTTPKHMLNSEHLLLCVFIEKTYTSQLITQSTHHTVNFSHGQLITVHSSQLIRVHTVKSSLN